MITYISLIALAGAIWWLVDRQRPQLDAAAAQRLEAFYGYSTAHHLQMLYIQRVYQRAQTGSKAYVSVYNDPTSAVRDAWFWWTQVQQGSVVAVQPSEGWGPHTGRDDVLFVGTEQSRQPAIYAAVDAKTLRRARRHRAVRRPNQRGLSHTVMPIGGRTTPIRAVQHAVGAELGVYALWWSVRHDSGVTDATAAGSRRQGRLMGIRFPADVMSVGRFILLIHG